MRPSILVAIAVTGGAFALASSWRIWRLHTPARQDTAQATTPHLVMSHVPVPVPIAPRGFDSSVSPVPLPLILTATRPGRSAHEGFADIGVNAKTPQTYAVGSLLANGCRLAEIYGDSVLLTREGRSLRLYIHGNPNVGPSRTTPLSPLATVGGVIPAARLSANSSEPVLDYIRATPVYDGASLRGYEVYAGSAPEVFAKIGLQRGDVITSIEGTRVTDPEIVIPQLRTLANGGSLTVTVERKTGASTLVLDGRLIADVIEQKATRGAVVVASSVAQ